MKLAKLAAFIIVCVCLAPILRSGLYSDDLSDFQMKNTSAEGLKQNVFQLSQEPITSWQNMGRITYLTFIWQEVVFKYFTSVFSFKMLQLVMNLLAVIAFLFCLKALDVGINSAIWLVCFAAVVQFRTLTVDVFTSLHSMYQLLAVFVFGALGFYGLYLKYKRYGYLIISTVLYAAAILMGEVGLLTVMMLPALALMKKISFRAFIISTLPLAAISAAYVGFIIWLRMNYHPEHMYEGLIPNFALADVIPTYEKQFLGGLPLFNLYRQQNIAAILINQAPKAFNLVSLVIIIAVSVYLFIYLKRRKQSTVAVNLGTIAFVLCLMAFPPLFIVTTVKYQQQLKWGDAYLPVFLQVFGSATLIAYLIEICINRAAAYCKIIGYSLFAFAVSAIVISLLFNNAMIDNRNYNYSDAVQAEYEAIKAGLLQPCEPGSTIILTHSFWWYDTYPYQRMMKFFTGKEFTVYFKYQWKPDTTVANSNCYIIECSQEKKLVVSLNRLNCNNHSIVQEVKRFEMPANETPIQAELDIHYKD